MFIRTKFYINRLTQTYFTAFYTYFPITPRNIPFVESFFSNDVQKNRIEQNTFTTFYHKRDAGASFFKSFLTRASNLNAFPLGYEQDVGTISSRKHVPAIITPLNPTNIAKLGYAGVYIFSYFCSKHRWWVFVRTALPRRF